MKPSDAARRVNEAYREILLLPAGRLVLRDLLSRTGLLTASAGVDRGVFVGGEATFWREGRRSIGIEVVAKLNELTPHAYATLTHETANELVESQQSARVRVEEDSE